MQRIKRIDERLHAWAAWRLSGSGGCRGMGFEYVEGSGGFGSTEVEFTAAMEAEAVLTDRAIAALPPELGGIVIAYYTWGGGVSQIEEKFRITRATVHRRLCHADIRLGAWFEAQAAMRVRNKSASVTI